MYDLYGHWLETKTTKYGFKRVKCHICGVWKKPAYLKRHYSTDYKHKKDGHYDFFLKHSREIVKRVWK